METVWIAGGNSYETIGVMHLLKNSGIATKHFQLGHQLCAGDRLIVCVSNTSLLGWWRYLKIIHWVAHRYAIELVVLCPDEVYRIGIVCGRNIVAVNGKCSCFQLSQLLLRAVQCDLSRNILNGHKDCICVSFLEKASQALQVCTVSEADNLTIRRAYYRRDMIVQQLGFSSLMRLKVFMAGL